MHDSKYTALYMSFASLTPAMCLSYTASMALTTHGPVSHRGCIIPPSQRPGKVKLASTAYNTRKSSVQRISWPTHPTPRLSSEFQRLTKSVQNPAKRHIDASHHLLASSDVTVARRWWQMLRYPHSLQAEMLQNEVGSIIWRPFRVQPVSS